MGPARRGVITIVGWDWELRKAPGGRLAGALGLCVVSVLSGLRAEAADPVKPRASVLEPAHVTTVAAAAAPATAPASSAGFSEYESLSTLLSRGELTLVESRPAKSNGVDGGLKQVTAIALVAAPIEAVWKQLIAFPSYTTWMPKVTECTPTRTEGNEVDVQWNIDVPGPNYRYLTRNVLDRSRYRIEQSQLEGALKGSHWSWQLIAQGESTLVYRTVFTNVTDESWLARQLDDESHTLSYGINVSTGLLEVRALRRVMERR